MEKHILIQYKDMIQEIERIKNRKEILENKLKCIKEGSNVKDAVKGGYGGIQTYHIEGYPVADEEETEYNLKKTVRLLNDRILRLEEMTVEVENYLDGIDCHMRSMISLKYFEKKTWKQVADAMGKSCTAASCQKAVERFLKKL